MDLDQYMGMFMDEAKEHLQVLNECLLRLEANPNEKSSLDEIFRSAHTLKGMSATMGFHSVAELTHEMENVLDKLRKDTLEVNEDIVNLLFACVDSLEKMVEDISNSGGAEFDIKPMIVRLQNISQGKSGSVSAPKIQEAKPKTVVVEESASDLNIDFGLEEQEEHAIYTAQEEGLNVFALEVVLVEGCILKAARTYMVMTQLENNGDVIKTIPSVQDLENENFEHSFAVLFVTTKSLEEIIKKIKEISEIAEVNGSNYVLAEQENVLGHIENTPPEVTQKAEKTETKENGGNTNVDKNNDKKSKGSQSVRVDIERLDDLLNLVGELVINKTRLAQIGLNNKLTELVETIEQMERVTTDLQNVVMKVRMVPVSQVFNRFPRMVRDLAREIHKDINLVITGEETELDRTVIDEIGDPLVHLLRNSIDHGIELPEEREAAGKSPTGQVSLIARYEGNNVIIEVVDDGHGIDANRIRRKAVEKNVLTQQEVDKLDDNEALRLIFLPGFSTAEKVTDISGRGVGMDAVRNKIESLGGNIDLETTLGKGSKFKIRLPLTLAITQALMIGVAEEIYAIPLGAIDSTINITEESIKTVRNKEVILLRGEIIPIVRLDKALNIPRTEAFEQEEIFVVIVHVGTQKIGIIVDGLIGQQEIVIKSLGKLMNGIKIIAGATILGNGRVSLIIDVASLA